MKLSHKFATLFTLVLSLLFWGCVASVNERGFNTVSKVHTKTNTLFDEDGYDFRGYDADGYNSAGFDWQGFDKNGFNSKGFDEDGFNKDGVDKFGFKKDGTHSLTGTKYDSSGYNRSGFNAEGYDRNGFDENGKDKEGNYKSVRLEFYSLNFIKDLKVDGFTVEWPTREESDYIAGSVVSYDVPTRSSESIDVNVETELIVEYTTFAMNGFGQHRNESSKKIKVKLPYKIGKNKYEHRLR